VRTAIAHLALVSAWCMLLAGCSSSAEVSESPPVSKAAAATTEAPAIYPGETWTWAETPEELGWSMEKLAQAREYSESIGSAAVMIVDDGVVIDAWGDIERTYHCHSMRKSLISALYGIFVDEGKIDLSATLLDLGINDMTPLTQTESRATVADLLKARSGIYIRAAGEAQSMVDVRPARGSHAPGTFWYYNNWDFNALGTIFDQKTGAESIYAAFNERIAEPIGMQDYDPDTLHYTYVDYTVHPYYGFQMSARDLARFGLLFLREGAWDGRQVIPSDWVRESTMSYSDRGDGGGYGYMWWTGTGTGLFPGVTVPEQCFYASGYRGHNVIVLPFRNLVVVHRVNTFELEPDIAPNQVGILLWSILDAAGVENIGHPPFIDQAPGTRLDDAALHEAIVGRRLEAMGGSAGMFIESGEDGSLSILMGDQPIYTGSWAIEAQRFCVDIPESDDIGGCFDVVRDEENVYFYEKDGTLSIGFRFAGSP